nr:inositol 1,3,4-trisphosphate 5/6-kinase 4 isoform X1 [Tanacetum cinerariifolium]
MCADEDGDLLIDSSVKRIPKVFVVSTLVNVRKCGGEVWREKWGSLVAESGESNGWEEEGISYPVGLSETKVSFLEKLISIHAFERFIYDPSSMDDTIRAVSLAWDNNGVSILHLVSNCNQGLVPKSLNYGWMNVVVNFDGNADGPSKNPNGIFIEKLEDVPLTICQLNKKSLLNNMLFFVILLVKNGRVGMVGY